MRSPSQRPLPLPQRSAPAVLLRALAAGLAIVGMSACSSAVPAENSMENSAEDSTKNLPSSAAMVAAAESVGLLRVQFPEENPGIPAYARLGRILNQVFHDDTWLVVPFYRQPDLIPGGFDLLNEFDFPGPNGPGAFAVPLTVSGYFMIERDASPTTFPRIAISRGSAVPVWFVRWSTFEAAAADGVVTMDDLRGMSPVRGTATNFEETLRPRAGEHLLIINARGTTEDGRAFSVHIAHLDDKTTSLRLTLK